MQQPTKVYGIVFIIGCFSYMTVHAQTIMKVGPGQTYQTISAAYAAIPDTYSGHYIIQLETGFTAAGETFPITFTAKTGADSLNTITIQPGASGLQVAGSTFNSILTFQCKYVTIDGRVNGSGTVKDLAIINYNTNSGNTVIFNGADYCNIRYCSIIGVNPSGKGVFELNQRNDHIIIENNDITGIGPDYPDLAIYSGSTNSTLTSSYVNIIDNNIFDFISNGIMVNRGNNWTITGNSFYLSPGLTAAMLQNPIRISDYQGYAFDISGNFIGGSEPRAEGQPMKWDSVNARFTGISLNISNFINPQPVSIKNNIIGNMDIKAIASSNVWTGIYAETNSYKMLEISGNIIGDSINLEDIKIDVPITSGDPSVQCISAGGRSIIRNNLISGIKLTGQTNRTKYFTGISIGSGGGSLIEYNVIGSWNSPASLEFGDSLSQGDFNIVAINEFGDSTLHNLISNIEILSDGSFIGIEQSNHLPGWDPIESNIIRKISSNSTSKDGIVLIKTDVSSVIGNILDNISLTNPDAQGLVGIHRYATYASTRSIENNILSNFFSKGKTNPTTDCAVIGIYNLESGIINSNTLFNFINESAAESKVCGIKATGNTLNITSNTIRNLVSNGLTLGSVFGIENLSGINISNISDNIIDSLNCIGSSSECYITGIYDARLAIITGNKISNLISDNSGNSNAVIAGIQSQSLVAGNEINHNLIYSLKNGSVNSDSASITGIVSMGSGAVHIYQNAIYGFYLENTSPEPIILGIETRRGNIYNNIIQLGISPAGVPLNGDFVIVGIRNDYPNDTVAFNSVFIGGNNISGANSTIALNCLQNSVVSNNILCNARTNGSGSGKHYAQIFNSISNQINDYNIYYAPGNGGVLASVDRGVTDLHTINDLQSAIIGQNLNSLNVDPLFVNANGDTTNLSLSLGITSPALASGQYLSLVQKDFYDIQRGNPPSRGAIELPDFILPVISAVSASCSGTNDGSIQVVQPSALVWDSLKIYNASNQLIKQILNFVGNTVIDNLLEGSYMLRFALDNGAFVILPVTIEYGDLSPLAPVALPQAICSGNTATLTATGQGGTYQWFNSQSGGSLLGTGASFQTPALTAPATFYVQVTSNGCASQRTAVNVSILQVPSVTLNPFNDVCDDSGPILLSGGNPAGGAYSGNGVDDDYFNPSITGVGSFNITYSYTDSGGCSSSVQEQLNVVTCTRVSELGNVYNINLYPNPTHETFNVTIDNRQYLVDQIILLDIRGKEVLSTSQTEISASGLAKGLYFVHVELTNGQGVVKKVMIK